MCHYTTNFYFGLEKQNQQEAFDFDLLYSVLTNESVQATAAMKSDQPMEPTQEDQTAKVARQTLRAK